MLTGVEHYGDVSKDDLLLLEQIRRWLGGLPDKGNPDHNGAHLWSCHAVCRAAVSIFGLYGRGWRTIDGQFMRVAFEHAWLVRETRNVAGRDNCTTVIDILPVAAAGGPFICSVGHWNSPWFDAYQTGRLGRYGEDRLAEFREEAKALILVTGDYKI